MPFVHVHWFEGRSAEQKAEIAKRIEAALVEVAGVSPEHCWVKSLTPQSQTSSSVNLPDRVAQARRSAICSLRPSISMPRPSAPP